MAILTAFVCQKSMAFTGKIIVAAVFQKRKEMLGFQSRKAKRGEEYIERSVKKYPKILFWSFLIYFLLFAGYMGWYFYFINTFALCKVEGISMQNTLNPYITSADDCDDWFYLYNDKKPELFDIVVVTDIELNEQSEEQEVSLVKRVIALEGDLVTIKRATGEGEDGYFHVYVQRVGENYPTMLQEDYVKSYYEWTYGGSFSQVYEDTTGESVVEYEYRFHQTFINNNEENTIKIDDTWYYRVPEGCVFYLGDNRARSSDSRVRGVGSLSEVQGVAEIILHDAEDASDAERFGIKFVSIAGYYWEKVENAFAR